MSSDYKKKNRFCVCDEGRTKVFGMKRQLLVVLENQFIQMQVYGVIFTGRNEVLAKVMFLQASCDSVHRRGVSAPNFRGGVCSKFSGGVVGCLLQIFRGGSLLQIFQGAGGCLLQIFGGGLL